MKIVYLKSINPITIEDKPTKKMVSLVNTLLESDGVKTFDVINYFSHPKLKKFDISMYVGKNLVDVISEQFPVLLKSFTTYPDCNLPNGVVASLTDFMLLMSCFKAIINTDKLPVVNTPEYQYIYGREKAIEFLKKYPSDDVGFLVFKFKTSRSKLDLWLTESWNYIKKLNQKLPKNNLDGKLSSDGKSNLPKNFAKDLLIYLCKKYKFSYSKIANALSELFPEDSALMDVDQIKSRNSRMKKYLSNSKKTIDLMNVR